MAKLTEWQPIETAPRTGDVLVFNGSVQRVAHFYLDHWCVYVTKHGDIVVVNGVTHWQPLPEPPK